MLAFSLKQQSAEVQPHRADSMAVDWCGSSYFVSFPAHFLANPDPLSGFSDFFPALIPGNEGC